MTNRSKLDSLIKAATAVIVAEDREMIARLDTSSVKFSDEFDAKIKAYILKMKRKGATVARMHKAFWVAACIIAFLPVVFFTLLRPGTSPVAPPDTVTESTEMPDTEPPVTKQPEVDTPESEENRNPIDNIIEGESISSNYSDTLNDYHLIKKLSKGNLIDDSDLRDAAEATWNQYYGDQLPRLYVALKWYISKYGEVTKDEFWEAVKDDSDLSWNQVSVMFTFNDETVMFNLHNAYSFYFKGTVYSPLGMRTLMKNDYGMWNKVLSNMKDSTELADYIENLKTIGGNYRFANELTKFFSSFETTYTIGDYYFENAFIVDEEGSKRFFEYVAKDHGHTEQEIDYLYLRFYGSTDKPVLPAEGTPGARTVLLHQLLTWYNSKVHPVTYIDLLEARLKYAQTVSMQELLITVDHIDILFGAINNSDSIEVLESFRTPLSVRDDGGYSDLKSIANACKHNSVIAKQYKRNEELKNCLAIANSYTFNDENTEHIELLKEICKAEPAPPETEPTLELTLDKVIELASGYDHSSSRALLLAVSSELTENELMDKAKALIDEKRFDAAYVILSVIDTDEAEELMKQFKLLTLVESDYTYYYINVYDENGNLVKVQRKQRNKNGSVYEDYIIYTYNSLGQLIHERNTEDGLTEIDFTYDDEGRLSMEYYVNSAPHVQTVTIQTTYDYDKNGNLIKKTVKYLDSPLKKVVTYEYEYNENSAVAKYTTTSYFEPGGFDDQEFINYTKDIDCIIYDYDPTGNLIKETHTYHDYITDSKWNIIEETYSLPDEYVTYKYDENGLLVEYHDTSWLSTVTYEYDDMNRLIYKENESRHSYTTDENGNEVPVMKVRTTAYTYNEDGMLIQELMAGEDIDPYSFDYTYDCFGNLLTHEKNSKNDYDLIYDNTYSYVLVN